jgi:Kef-type K+ transport system membrane component KefB
VTLVVASAAIADGALSPDLFSVLVGVALVSTLLGPPLMRVVLPTGLESRRRKAIDDGPPEAAGWDPEARGP